MTLPKPSPKKYLSMIATILVMIAVLQYTGIFAETSGEIDLAYLAAIGLVLPFSTYLLTVAAENVAFLPDWDEMNQTET